MPNPILPFSVILAYFAHKRNIIGSSCALSNPVRESHLSIYKTYLLWYNFQHFCRKNIGTVTPIISCGFFVLYHYRHFFFPFLKFTSVKAYARPLPKMTEKDIFVQAKYSQTQNTEVCVEACHYMLWRLRFIHSYFIIYYCKKNVFMLE